jgi:hypothetical protein
MGPCDIPSHELSDCAIDFTNDLVMCSNGDDLLRTIAARVSEFRLKTEPSTQDTQDQGGVRTQIRAIQDIQYLLETFGLSAGVVVCVTHHCPFALLWSWHRDFIRTHHTQSTRLSAISDAMMSN